MFDIVNSFLGWVWSHDGDGWMQYWDVIVFTCIFTLGGMTWFGGWLAWRKERYRTPDIKVWAGCVRGFTGGLLLTFGWPYVLIAVLPVAALAGIAFLAWGWYDLIPSKAERIAKREEKVRDLRGKVAATR